MRSVTISKFMLKEMSVFELTKTRTKNLDMLINVLKGICVTSLEAERSFSASGLFVKLRTCLNDDQACGAAQFFSRLRSGSGSQQKLGSGSGSGSSSGSS